MKLERKLELALMLIVSVLSFILLLSFIRKLRSIAPWRVNCWFCNCNVWVKFPDRNSWTCPKCEQYNGFSADGDYNKQLYSSKEHIISNVVTPKVFKGSPPKNGLCKMCNVNQQLKVVQLASFVPINEKRFDEEIETYRLQLEKAYKLCSPCRKVVQMKLHKEKESLLGFKLIQSRTPEKKLQKNKQQNNVAKDLVEKLRTVVTVILFASILLDCSRNLYHYEHLPSTLVNMKEIGKDVIERLYNIVRMKTLTKYPDIEDYLNNFKFDLPSKLNASFEYDSNFDEVNKVTQKVLGGLVCVFQILGHLLELNSWRAFVTDFLFLVLVGVDIWPELLAAPLIVSLVKFGAVSAVLLLCDSPKPPKPPTITLLSPHNKLKHLSKPIKSPIEDDSSSASDDDVSLNKFGINHLTDSSNEHLNSLSGSLNGLNGSINGLNGLNGSLNGFKGSVTKSRAFAPRATEIIWSKPKLKSTFSFTKSVASRETFSTPAFSNYQSLGGESDSDLDESISSLSIGSPEQHRAARGGHSVFALRQFSAAPGFLAPRARPLISPSKLGHSWVAGGYWGADGAPLAGADGSRSSSQSSGFESQASSVQRLAPASREPSACREPERPPERPRAPGACPVYPRLQYNSHVHIPQLIQPDAFRRLSASRQHDYVQNNTFKAPGGSRLIKLPQMGSFSTN